MRLYSAKLVSTTTKRWGGISAEIVSRQLDSSPAEICTTMTQHALYAELSAGVVSEREVVGFHHRKYVSRHHLVSFRPVGATVRGTAAGTGIHTYGVIFMDPECDGLRPYLAQMSAEWTPFSGLRNDRLWDEIAPLLAECTIGETTHRPLGQFYALGRAISLLALLTDGAGVATCQQNRDGRIREAVKWIDENLTREFTLDELASVANTSASQLVRLFSKTLGLTPMAYVSVRRIREAQRLLASSAMSIGQIASHLGYADQSHFTQRFKSNTGVTPAAYRRGQCF